MFQRSLSLLIFVDCLLRAQAKNASVTAGGIVRVSLSNYSNPHQVLADTGQRCDSSGSPCDPIFVVKLGTQQFLFQQEQRSQIFLNAERLNGEFYSSQFHLLRELPDTLFIDVTIEDSDVFDTATKVLAHTTVGLPTPLPTITRRGNSSWSNEIFCTPENQHVRFTLTVQIWCFPGLYGRRCSTQCSGEPVYRDCSESDSDCANSLEIVGCRDKTADSLLIEALKSGGIKIIVIASVLLGVLAVTTTAVTVYRCRRRKRLEAKQRQELLGRLLAERTGQHQSQPSLANSMRQPSLGTNQYQLSASSLTSSFKNPVYHSATQPLAQSSLAGSSNEPPPEEAYEVVDDLDNRAGPPLPPKDVPSLTGSRLRR